MRPWIRGYDDDEQYPYELHFGEHPYTQGKYADGVIVRREHLGPGTVAELAQALTSSTETVYFTDDGDDDYHESVSETIDVWLDTRDGDPKLVVQFRLPAWLDWADEDRGSIESLVDPVLKVTGLTIMELELLTYWPYGRLTLGWQASNPRLAELLEAGEDVLALLEASRRGPLTAKTLAGLVRAGRAGSLVGQPENEWFDAKSMHYALDSAAGRLSLCESVARFCNSPFGGVIVVGLGTSSSTGLEIVSKVQPVPRDDGIASRYRKILDAGIYPVVHALRVEGIPDTRGSMVMLIEVRSQPQHLQPFLVKGALVDGKVRGEYISVVERRDADSEPIRIATIHAWISAGRAFLERTPDGAGKLPELEARRRPVARPSKAIKPRFPRRGTPH
jgi:hypothetical protein